MKSKGKIIYLVNNFYEHGGITRMLSSKIDAWTSLLGYEITVITVAQKGEAVVYPPKAAFDFIDLNLPGINQHQIFDLIRFFKKINRIIKEEKPIAVITSLTGVPSLMVPFIQRKVPKFLEIHSSGALSVTKSWRFKWWFLNQYKRVVLLNEDEKKYYRLRNMTVIPNFIPLEKGEYPPFENRKQRIVAAGRIHPDKQYDHLILIWEKVYKEFPDWTMEIYGNGDEHIKAELNNYIQEKSILNIHFFPATTHLKEIFKGSSLLALTSDTESFSLVLTEAKAAALPAIAYDAPTGPRHVISNDGVLVKHRDISAFTENLKTLMKNSDRRKRMSENAWKNKAQFSAPEIIRKWEELL